MDRGGPGAAAPHRTGRPGKGAAPGRLPGGVRSPRSSSPSLNWPLSLIRSCRSSSGLGGSRAGLLCGPGPGAAAKGAWPRGGAGTAGPEGLRRSLPAAGSMARGGGSGRRRRTRRGLESEVRGAATRSGQRDGRTAGEGGREREGAEELRCAGSKLGGGVEEPHGSRGRRQRFGAALSPPRSAHGAGAGGRDPPRGPGARARSGRPVGR